MVGHRRSQRTLVGTAIAAGSAAAAFAWAVRGRSSTVFGPSVWHGPRDTRALALTFDDGPSPRTPRLLDVLAKHRIPATFFVCGAHVRLRPSVACDVVDAGHELGNHSDTHPRLWLHSPSFIRDELRRAQESIHDATGRTPALFRPPYGVRWFGLRDVQRELNLLGIMWSCIGLDWKLDAGGVAARMLAGATNGAILCLHDGRGLNPSPDISNTIAAVDTFVPRLLDQGYAFRTVSSLIGYSSP